MSQALRAHLRAGQVIPAHPLALDNRRQLDERRQRALTRYYMAAGAGGIAVAVHTTQFQIRAAKHGLLEPVLALTADTVRDTLGDGDRSSFALIAGAIGSTRQAVREAALARDLGYDAVLLSLAALREAATAQLVRHCRAVAEVLPLFGFYLQPAVGGRVLDFDFWSRFAEIENVVAIKIAPFNRYATIEVVRAAVESGRDDIALYTGNDDNIVADLMTPVPVRLGQRVVERRIVGGLLGQWAVWTRSAVALLKRIQGQSADPELLALGAALTDANGAIFDARHDFAGCIPGIHEVLRRQGLLASTRCLDPKETLSPGQKQEIARVVRSYPELVDDDFIQQHLDEWLR
ncbi:MAG TPA: dihydrodipicolinate synthase family protein [Gemmatimonadaceae bacterium]|nr:dihydrodipicolinate synthase family protein [Gemmatimonadaceae bacterium]